MSYYESNYYENPGPAYCSSDDDEPVPGWGGEANMAGGRVVGLGLTVAPIDPEPRQMTTGHVIVPLTDGEDIKQHAGLPWWAWIIITASVGAAIGVARNRGLLTKVGLPR